MHATPLKVLISLTETTLVRVIASRDFIRVAILGISVVFFVTLLGCGSFFSSCHMCPPIPQSKDFVYTANAGGSQSTVSALASDSTTAALTSIAGSPYNTGSGSVALAKDPASGRLYVANSLSVDISTFVIDLTTGALGQVAGSPFAAESGMDVLAIDPSGGFLYGVSGNSANLRTFSIDVSGGLTAVAGTPILITAASESSSVVIDPSGKYLYTTTGDSLSASIYGFGRNGTTGALTPLSGFPLALAGLANKTAFNPGGKLLLVTGTNVFGTQGGVEVFSFNSSTGALSLASGPVQAGDDPAGLALDASGKYVYVPNTADVNISAFVLDGSSGALTAVAGSPFPSGGQGSVNGPLGIATSSVGSFAYVCNASNDVSVFSVNTGNGALTPIAGSPFPDGGNAPSAIAFVP